jgi:hypothetical protein
MNILTFFSAPAGWGGPDGYNLIRWNRSRGASFGSLKYTLKLASNSPHPVSLTSKGGLAISV